MFPRFLLLLLVILSAGCFGDLGSVSGDDEHDSHGLIEKEYLWPDPSNIPVCWESGAESYQDEKRWVRQAVTSTWSKANPDIQFTGWGDCTATHQGIRIVVANSSNGPYSRLGIDSLQHQPSMQLSFDLAGQHALFGNDDFLAPCVKSDANRKTCIKSIAIHEFGHALGFRHEQDRSDVAKPCDREYYYPRGGWIVDPYDAASIMNYCKEGRVLVTKLSAGDVKAVKALYSDTLTPDPGRPKLEIYAPADGTFDPGDQVDIEVGYSNFSDPAALPDPATALRASKDGGQAVTVALGPWTTFGTMHVARGSWSLPPSDSAYELVFEWNGKYADRLDVGSLPPSAPSP